MVVGSFVDSVTGEVRQLVMPLLGKLVNFYDSNDEQFLNDDEEAEEDVLEDDNNFKRICATACDIQDFHFFSKMIKSTTTKEAVH